MVRDFDDSKHWVDIYRLRVRDDAPKPEMLVCTKFAAASPENTANLPAYSGYPPRLIFKLLAARAAMLFSR
jgi:hypothetical protein